MALANERWMDASQIQTAISVRLASESGENYPKCFSETFLDASEPQLR